MHKNVHQGFENICYIDFEQLPSVCELSEHLKMGQLCGRAGLRTPCGTMISNLCSFFNFNYALSLSLNMVKNGIVVKKRLQAFTWYLLFAHRLLATL